MNDTATVWLINNIPNSNTLQLNLSHGNDRRSYNLPYIADCDAQKVQRREQLPVGEWRYTINNTGNLINNEIQRGNLKISGDGDNILVIQGNARNLNNAGLNNYLIETGCPANGYANVTFIHAASALPNVQVGIIRTVQTTGATGGTDAVIAGEYQQLTGQNTFASTRTYTVPTGPKLIRVTRPGTGAEVLSLPNVNLESRNYYLIASGERDPCVILIVADCKNTRPVQTSSHKAKWNKIGQNIYIGH
jgi:hypothetical protein